MANANLANIGAVNNTGALDATFLKMFSGEVMTAFNEISATKGRHFVKNIKNGKSAQFPQTWKLGTEYHTSGNEILGMDVYQNEVNIVVDPKLITHVFLDEWEEAVNHFDVRSIYSNQIGEALARTYDTDVFRETVKGMKATSVITDGVGTDPLKNSPAGTEVSVGATNAAWTANTDKGATLAAALYGAAEQLDLNDVPNSDRYAFFKPYEYYQLVQQTDNINMDWKGQGSYSMGKIAEVAGLPIIKSNHLPQVDSSGDGTHHSVDASLVKGLVFHKTAVGTTSLRGISTESEYDMRRQGYLMLGKYIVGHGWLRPDAIVGLTLDAAA